MRPYAQLTVADLPQTIEEWADYAHDLLVELKRLCKDPVHTAHLDVVKQQIAHNDGDEAT